MLVQFLTRGSRVNRVQQLLLEIKNIERTYCLKIQPVWINRDNKLIQIADTGTKNNNTDSWCYSDSDFFRMLKVFDIEKIDIDLMAEKDNARSNIYFSKLPEPGCAQVDVFHQQLPTDKILYCCPPVNEAARIIDKILNSPGVTIALVLPRWPTQPYWAMLKSETGFIPQIKEYLFFYTRFYSKSPKSLFNGSRKFQLASFFIKT